MAPRAAAPRERRDGDRFQRGRDRADSHTQRARVADPAAPRQKHEPPPQRGGGRAPRRCERGDTTERATRSASAAPQAAAPRERSDGDRPQRGRDRADSHAQRACAADHVAPRQERESPTRKNGGRVSRHRERGGTTERTMRSASAERTMRSASAAPQAVARTRTRIRAKRSHCFSRRI